MNTEEFLTKYQEPRYLADGVYATYDGYQYCLFTQEGNKIYLDPDTIWLFNQYRQEIKEAIEKISS